MAKCCIIVLTTSVGVLAIAGMQDHSAICMCELRFGSPGASGGPSVRATSCNLLDVSANVLAAMALLFWACCRACLIHVFDMLRCSDIA